MDIHIVDTEVLNAEDVAKAHVKDVQVQDKYQVVQLKYWVDADNKKIFCLMKGPSKEACHAVHQESHGMTACNIVEVSEDESSVLLLGERKNDLAYTESGELDNGFRTLLQVAFHCFDNNRRQFDPQFRTLISDHQGQVILQPGPFTLGSFYSAAAALDCAMAITNSLETLQHSVEYTVCVFTGQLLEQDSEDLFGTIKKQMACLVSLGTSNRIYLDENTWSLALKCSDTFHDKIKGLRPFSNQELIFLHTLYGIVESQLGNAEFTVALLNKSLALSKASAYRMIKSLTGCSPREIIRKIRLHHSLRLLKRGHYSISEITYLTGFNSPSYFTRAFKNRFGILPTFYRDNH